MRFTQTKRQSFPCLPVEQCIEGIWRTEEQTFSQKIYEKTVPQPHPPHKGSTFHRRIQYLQTGKLWRGFLQKSTMKTFLQRTKFISGSNWQTFLYAEGKKTFCAEINNNHIAFPMLSTSTDPCMLGWPGTNRWAFWLFLFHGLSHPHLLISHSCSFSHLLSFKMFTSWHNNNFPVFLCLSLSLSLYPLSFPFLSVAFFVGTGGESRNVNPFGRNEGRWPKAEVGLQFTCAGAKVSQKMRVDRRKLMSKWNFICGRAKLSHKMTVDRHKLRLYCKFFTCAGLVLENPFARNEGRSSKTEAKMQFNLCRTSPGETLWHEIRASAQNSG